MTGPRKRAGRFHRLRGGVFRSMQSSSRSRRTLLRKFSSRSPRRVSDVVTKVWVTLPVCIGTACPSCHLWTDVESCRLAVLGQSGSWLLCYRPVSYTHLRAHETPEQLVCRLLLEKK